MNSVYFVMMIMGCGDGSAGCVDARLDTARFATMAQCRAQLADGIARNTDISYPVIAASCRSSAPVVVAKAGRAIPRG